MKFSKLMVLAAIGSAAYYYRDELKTQWEKWTSPHDSMGSSSASTDMSPSGAPTGPAGF